MSKRIRRSGVVLLVVLSLLVLFTILMVTFLVVAGQYRIAARATSHSRQQVIEPMKLAEQGVFTLIRDTPNQRSVLRGHSLLMDLYGLDGFKGTVMDSGAVGFFSSPVQTDATNGQFFDVRLNNGLLDAHGNSYTRQGLNGYYNGCVLTTVATSDNSVSARSRLGLSYRIMGYSYDPTTPAPNDHLFRLMSASSDVGTAQKPLAGDTVIVNGRPFNGTGFGYDRSFASTRYLKLSVEALKPNQFGQTTAQFTTYLVGGADEGYDAVDFQNMALAAVIPSDGTSTAEGRNVPAMIIPSFHRPDLIFYWRNNFTNWKSDRQRSVFRPMPWDHPEFTGGNGALSAITIAGADGRPGVSNADDDGDGTTDNYPELGWPGSDDNLTALLTGPWDVDTDGDGIKDSIWVDLDFPLQTTSDGRLIKPLFAFNCQDLDSRLNVNAHGSFAHIHDSSLRPSRVNDATTLARNVASNTLPKGAGYGPAEVYLGSLFNTAQYQRLLLGDTQTGLRGRYGDDRQPGANSMDLLASVKFFDIPSDYFNNAMAANPVSKSYNSVPDLAGELAIGLDHRGQPTSDRPSITDSLSNTPYEINLGQDTARGSYNPALSGAAQANDQPFSIAELERILRAYDTDAGLLPDRLVNVLNITGTANPFTTSSLSAANRRIVTTDSYDLPVPSMIAPSGRAGDFEGNATLYPAGRPLHFLDFIRQRHLAALGIGTPNSAQLTTLNNLLGVLVSPDLAMGLKMDLNRPFGNGVDDNTNGVVDEHGPIPTAQLEADPSVAEKIWSNTVFFDHDNDGNTTTDTDAYLARYHYARHLYVLAMTLKRKNGAIEHRIDFEGNGLTGTSSDDFETARGLAQWAINVVDFRDADSIMTPFEFDPNPFDRWSVDGNPATDEGTDGGDSDGDGTVDEADEARYIVWGAERPELLLTETLAFHDRRTEDLPVPNGLTTDDQGGGNTGETDTNFMAGNLNNDFDQRHRPRGYAYIELYNPWSSDIERYPQEFYNGNAAMSGVVLNRVNGGGSPVWRLAVTQYVPVGGQDIDNRSIPTPPPALAIERVAYFSTTGPAEGTAKLHFGSPSATLAPLRPGRYAVVGTTHTTFDFNNPATNTADATEYVGLLGRRNNGTFNTIDTRRIVLHAESNSDANWVFVGDNNETARWLPNGAPASSTYVADRQPAVAVPMPDFNVSEGTYPANDANGVPFGSVQFNGEPGYTAPFDLPFDIDPTYCMDLSLSAAGVQRPTTDGTYTNVRTIHLQRLANPLLAYSATTNPYLTIDAMPLDVTFYHGIGRNANGVIDPQVTAGDPNFMSRQRGVDPNLDGDGDPVTKPGRNLWNPSTTPPGTTSGGAIANHYFAEEFKHTLGHLNTGFGASFTQDFSTPPVPNNTTTPSQAFVGAPDTRLVTPPAPAPPTDRGPPFPWLTWNNRPFVSQYELLWVPYQRSSKLLSTVSLVDSSKNPYSDPNQPSAQFAHILNLFDTSVTTTTNSGMPPVAVTSTDEGADLYWLMDYTHVPSRYLGAETWLNPETFKSDTTLSPNGTGTAMRHPPFNQISNYREPGKVNPNNVFDDRVWNGLLGPPFTGNGASHSDWVNSRRGNVGSSIVNFDPDSPTFFANPFRPVGYGRFVPLNNMERPDCECNLLRSQTIPDLANPPSASQPILPPLFAKTSGNTAVDPDRNPHFRYQSIQRFANLVTPRSNVYAIWVTVGQFEVDPTTRQLRQEAGIETSEVQRHRAFYVFDRTIPVAFEPGENHNVDRAILLKRFIE